MKITGRNIRRRLYSLSLLKDKIARAKFYHGYGVHSPFVYGLVRKVFMAKELEDTQSCELYNALLASGAPRKRAIQLQNAMHYCELASFELNGNGTADINIITADNPANNLIEPYNKAVQHKTALVIMAPYANRERRDACRNIVAQHRSTSVDNRGYIILFNNHLPKQHFRL